MFYLKYFVLNTFVIQCKTFIHFNNVVSLQRHFEATVDHFLYYYYFFKHLGTCFYCIVASSLIKQTVMTLLLTSTFKKRCFQTAFMV